MSIETNALKLLNSHSNYRIQKRDFEFTPKKVYKVRFVAQAEKSRYSKAAIVALEDDDLAKVFPSSSSEYGETFISYITLDPPFGEEKFIDAFRELLSLDGKSLGIEMVGHVRLAGSSPHTGIPVYKFSLF